MAEELLYALFFFILSALSYYQGLTWDISREDPWSIYDRSQKFNAYLLAFGGVVVTYIALLRGIFKLDGSEIQLLYSLAFFAVTGLAYYFSDTESPKKNNPWSVVPYYLHHLWICTACCGTLLLILALFDLFGSE